MVVAHCAGSNINLCSGIAPVRQMLNEGLWVTLGSDIAAGSSLSGSQMVTMSIRASKIRQLTDPAHRPLRRRIRQLFDTNADMLN